ncbi:hypothetical protein ACH5RR_035477 [Cinchona calisaya]|uniref:F-box domain-containing protein n=1 Tax=Cinchona calisaya TaxID=153742 RepID=A0ABD2Y0K9_9GENT
MDLAGIWAMCGKNNSSGSSSLGTIIKQKDSKCRRGGMEFESDWTKHRKSSAFTAQAIRSATSFLPWSCKISRSEGFHEFLGRKRASDLNMCFSNVVEQKTPAHLKGGSCLISKFADDFHSPILPGLPDDVAMYCLSLVPRSNFPAMGVVCKRWRSFIQSKEFIMVRKQAGMLEEWLYILTVDPEGNGNHWEVLDCWGQKHHVLPSMPGPVRVGFGMVVLNGKLLIIAGHAVVDGRRSPSADVYQYDSCLNSWNKLADMNVTRYDFACAEVNGMVYAVGGYGMNGESLSCAEVYDPDTNNWTVIESLRRPRWGCFAFGFEGKLYVMGGRSSFTIGNSKFVDVYNTERHTWCEMKNGCVMVTAHAVLGNKLFCIEWKNQRKLTIFDSEDSSWKMIPVPVTGSSSIGFQFGILDGKLLLFSLEKGPGSYTLLYDPNAAPGSEWQTSSIKPSGLCVCSVTIKA